MNIEGYLRQTLLIGQILIWFRLQSVAVFDKISGAEKAQILGAGAQNSCQVQITSGKSNKICIYLNNEN